MFELVNPPSKNINSVIFFFLFCCWVVHLSYLETHLGKLRAMRWKICLVLKGFNGNCFMINCETFFYRKFKIMLVINSLIKLFHKYFSEFHSHWRRRAQNWYATIIICRVENLLHRYVWLKFEMQFHVGKIFSNREDCCVVWERHFAVDWHSSSSSSSSVWGRKCGSR